MLLIQPFVIINHQVDGPQNDVDYIIAVKGR